MSHPNSLGGHDFRLKTILILENVGTKWNKKVTWFNHESSHFLFHFFDHWLSLAIPLWLPCSYDIDLNTVFLMQDSTNFVAKLSSPIVNDNAWSEISAVDMLVKKLCKALCSWARYGSKENTFQNCVNLLRRCHKKYLVQNAYTGGKTESDYAAL